MPEEPMPMIDLPTLQGDAPLEARVTFDALVAAQVDNWRECGEREDWIATSVTHTFGNCEVRGSAPIDSCPHVLLLWPKDAGTILAAVQLSLGIEAMDRMDAWARQEIMRQEWLISRGTTCVWRFAPRDDRPVAGGDDGYG